jgi:ABC-type branched-subunit amino acid transport system substrate-binding protein
MSSERRGIADANRTFGVDEPGDDARGDRPLAGKYALVRPLGAGGMASVYEAVHRNGNRVAIKVLHPLLACDAAVRARFLKEGYAANTVGHPGVVRVLDDDVAEDGSVFLVMELLEGETLAARAARAGGTLPEAEVAAHAVALLDVLSAAHARGVVHRDIKPDNLFVTRDGVLKVLDFGIAHLREDASSRLTSANQLLGTPAFMAPEQARGRSSEVDARTDLWAVGATMFTLLTGRPAHGEGSASDVLLRAATQAPPAIRDVRPATSPALAAVIDRALRVEVAERWPSAADMQQALRLRAAPVGPPPDAAPPAPRAFRRRGWAVAALGGLLAAGIGWAALRAPPAAGLPCGSAAACVAAGTPARCVAGVCRPLLMDGCHLLAEPGDAARDDTLWLGAMFPIRGPEAAPFGEPCLRGVELARQDFVEAVGGLPPVTPGGAVRRIAVVACDDSRDPAAVASHLIDDVRVPAVIGFARSREVTELTASHFHPRGVVALAANLAPSISALPLPSDGTRLVYRVTTSAASLAPATGAFLSAVLEPALRATGGRSPGAPLRVALVRVENASGVGAAAALTAQLRFNGRAALENGEAFRQILVPDALTDALTEAQVTQVANELLAFAPDVIVGAGGLGPEILGAVEQRWSDAAAPRPTYVTDWLEPADLAEPLRGHPDLRRRVFRVDAARSSATTQRFVLRYNERYSPPVTPATALPEPYDAFYLAAFALAAAGRVDPTDGRALARAVSRLRSPGRPVAASADDIAGALATLTAGGSIDLEGAGTGLDFDPVTGDPAATAAVYCLQDRVDGLVFADAGVTFDGRGGVQGTLTCD